MSIATKTCNYLTNYLTNWLPNWFSDFSPDEDSDDEYEYKRALLEDTIKSNNNISNRLDLNTKNITYDAKKENKNEKIENLKNDTLKLNENQSNVVISNKNSEEIENISPLINSEHDSDFSLKEGSDDEYEIKENLIEDVVKSNNNISHRLDLKTKNITYDTKKEQTNEKIENLKNDILKLNENQSNDILNNKNLEEIENISPLIINNESVKKSKEALLKLILNEDKINDNLSGDELEKKIRNQSIQPNHISYSQFEKLGLEFQENLIKEGRIGWRVIGGLLDNGLEKRLNKEAQLFLGGKQSEEAFDDFLEKTPDDQGDKVACFAYAQGVLRDGVHLGTLLDNDHEYPPVSYFVRTMDDKGNFTNKEITTTNYHAFQHLVLKNSGYRVIYLDLKDLGDLTEKMKLVKSKTNKKIELLKVYAHGSPSSISSGSMHDTLINSMKHTQPEFFKQCIKNLPPIKEYTIKSKELKNYKSDFDDVMSQDGIFYLHSCSTAHEMQGTNGHRSFASELNRVSGRTVIAPRFTIDDVTPTVVTSVAPFRVADQADLPNNNSSELENMQVFHPASVLEKSETKS